MPYVTSAGVRTFYRWDGAGGAPVLVLSNSLGTHHGMWDEQVPELAAHFRILRYDTRGHGSSETPRPGWTGEYDIALLGRDVLALLDALQVPKAHFCGLSLGGMTGQWLAANAPARIGRLVLACTSAHAGAREPWDARIELVRREGMKAVADTIVGRWFTPAFREAQPAKVDRIREMLLATPEEGYAACCAAVRDLDLRESLARISGETLVICGIDDVALPPEHSRAVAARIAGSRLVELRGSHLCNIESGRAFTDAVAGFLDH